MMEISSLSIHSFQESLESFALTLVPKLMLQDSRHSKNVSHNRLTKQNRLFYRLYVQSSGDIELYLHEQ